MKTIIKKIFPIILIVGLIAWAFGITYTGLSIVNAKTVNYGTYQWTYYEFDVRSYLQSIEHSLFDASIVNVVPKQPELPTAPNWTDILSILRFAFNSFFIWIINNLIYGLNWVVLAPTKLLLYPVNVLFALFGLNTANNDYIQAMQTLYSFEIPLIPAI